MLNDTQLSLLGDPSAADRMTESGKLVPCPFCRNTDDKRFTITFRKDRKKRYSTYYEICRIYCECCTGSVQKAGIGKDRALENATKMWNTRAPILTPEQIKKLEEEDHETDL